MIIYSKYEWSEDLEYTDPRNYILIHYFYPHSLFISTFNIETCAGHANVFDTIQLRSRQNNLNSPIITKVKGHIFYFDF